MLFRKADTDSICDTVLKKHLAFSLSTRSIKTEQPLRFYYCLLSVIFAFPAIFDAASFLTKSSISLPMRVTSASNSFAVTQYLKYFLYNNIYK